MILQLNISDKMHAEIASKAKASGLSVEEFILGRTILDVPNSTTLAAIAELESGGGTYYDNYEDLIKEIKNEV